MIMADLGSRPVLPQASRSFTFATQNEPNRDKQKNYVFVDEHNRHRRLKVMRACGACRRRKIKCDAATTNTWPCGACVKQNLECVPPSGDADGQDDGDDQGTFQSYQPHDYSSNASFNVSQYSQSQPSGSNEPYSYQVGLQATSDAISANGDWNMPPAVMYAHSTMPAAYQHEPPAAPPPTSTQASFPSDARDGSKEETPDSELTDALQDLRIDQGGVAPYIANQRTLAEGPAIEEPDAILPPSISKSSTVSIPPEMMPSDQTASQYIEYFFADVHPYIPVINRSYFLQQWNRNKFSISPLILEGMFACSAHNLQQHDDRNKWLALAARHEESFKDVPRLSTIQGLMLLLKAREAVPKRGYYYRSWMTVQYLVAMAKDLELDEHNLAHIRNEPCGSEDFDCAVKIRIWHAMFQAEMMIGGPQGRFDFRVPLDSVITNASQPFSGVDESELRISQDQIQMVRIVKNVRQTAEIYARLRKKGTNLAEEPDMVRHNIDYYNWAEGLPRHMQITYAPDGSAPFVPFHFAANLHAYHCLSVIMHHRPQLNMNASSYDHNWKQIMVTCYSAATKICRLHEALLKRYGLTGLSCMMRGVNTAIYTILTCTMLHLVAITSPDPDLNANAKDYFARHMRVLEQCATQWPMQSMQAQINSLREAFSADLSKPFELKPSFPFGSPPPSDSSSPPSQHDFASHASDAPRWSSYGTAPLTPPGTASTGMSNADFSANYQDASGGAGGYNAVSQGGGQVLDPSAHWDPSGVFDRWNAAFNTATLDSPSPGLASIQPVAANSASPSSNPMYASPQNLASYAGYAQHPIASPRFPPHSQAGAAATAPYLHQGGYVPPPHQQQQQQPSPAASAAAQQAFITPSMWQEVVAKSYGEGLKRRWDDGAGDGSYKRMR